MTQQRKDYGWGIFQLWLNWISATGAIALLIILSLWIRPLYLPFIAFGFQLILFTLIRRNRHTHIPSCYLVPFIVTRVLFWTGIVMIILNFLYSNLMIDLVFDRNEVNKEIPFICVLITSPITAIISGWAYIIRDRLSFCSDCKMRHGTPAERGFLGIIYSQIGHYQTGMMFWISAVSTIIGWGYYAMLYVNSSLSVPDRFIYIWLPTLIWLATAIYLAMRYLGIFEFYRLNVEGSLSRRADTTRIRYIIISGNRIAVNPPQTDPDMQINIDEKFDTPVELYIPRVDTLPVHQAAGYFSTLSGVSGAEIHPMYHNPISNLGCNIFHFFAILTPEQQKNFEATHPQCQWLDIRQIATLINQHLTNPLFSAEITRFHTIAQTAKTYSPEGRRRHPIKHYRPAVEFSDISNLLQTVDFDDSRWLYIAQNNQDTPFFALRRFWRKYINGVGQ